MIGLKALTRFYFYLQVKKPRYEAPKRRKLRLKGKNNGYSGTALQSAGTERVKINYIRFMDDSTANENE